MDASKLKWKCGRCRSTTPWSGTVWEYINSGAIDAPMCDTMICSTRMRRVEETVTIIPPLKLNKPNETVDMVNHPPHYDSTRIECFDAIGAMVESWPGEAAVCAGNVVKYVWRHRCKTPVESLKKARWYLDKLIEIAERGTK